MTAMSKAEIAKAVLRGVGENYSHAIIWCDTWDYTDFTRYVHTYDDIDEVIKEQFSYGNMYRIMEIYNYNLSILDQLNESAADNKEPKDAIKNEYGISNLFLTNDLKRAIDFAKDIHAGQFRKDGITPYINHPLMVLKLAYSYIELFHMQTLEDLQEINDIYVSCVLHDVLEMSDISIEMLQKQFSPVTVSMILELTNNNDKINLLGKTKYLQAKMLDMTTGAMFVKLCDRLANIKDLVHITDRQFQENYIKETYDIITYLLNKIEFNPFHLAVIKDIFEELKKISITLNLDSQNFNLNTFDEDNPNILALKRF